jgi:hypothetical protein
MRIFQHFLFHLAAMKEGTLMLFIAELHWSLECVCMEKDSQKRSIRRELSYVLHSRFFKGSDRKINEFNIQNKKEFAHNIIDFPTVCIYLHSADDHIYFQRKSMTFESSAANPFCAISRNSFRKPKLCVKIMQICKDLMSIEVLILYWWCVARNFFE